MVAVLLLLLRGNHLESLAMTSFRESLDDRIRSEILDRCTHCGKCVEACPMPEPVGLDCSDIDEPRRIVAGVIDRLSGGEGTADADTWAEACTGSGNCIKACPEAVNPRFMLAMARLDARRRKGEAVTREKSRESFGTMSHAVRALSRLQLPGEILKRIHPGPRKRNGSGGSPDVVFYTGCNLLKTPHIGLLCLEILDVMGVSYEVMGGPGQCCGVFQFREGDLAAGERIAGGAIDRFAATGAADVLTWCPTCVVQFNEISLPTIERSRGASAAFDMPPFYVWLAEHLDELKPHMTRSVERRVALVERPGIPAAREAAIAIAQAIPGVEYVPLPDVPRISLSASYLTVLPEFKERLQQEELDACMEAGVDTLATIFHPCHREICHLAEDRPLEVVNLMEIIGESIGVHVPDLFKKFKIMGDVDRIVAACGDMIEEHGLDVEALRQHLEAEFVVADPDASIGASDR